MSVSRAANVADPSASYDSWPSLPSTQLEGSDRCCCACCPRRRLSWTAVSVVEIALMVMTVVAYFFFPKDSLQRFLARDTDKGGQITELSEWTLRMVASMVSVQITLLVAGIGWGDAISRKIIYWGMLTGDVLLVAIHASLVHSLSEWHAVNIAVVTLASGFGLFRIITLILNPNWWAWVQVEAGY